MRKLILKMQLSLDGFMSGPQGEVDWIFSSIDEGARSWLLDTLWQAGVHLMGAETYRAMAAHWPDSKDAFAAPMNEIPKFVFSKSLQTADWGGTRIVDGDLGEEISRLKSLPGRDLLAHGGTRFARSLVRLGLVDEYRLMVHPVVLGKGLSLFGAIAAPRQLKLMGSLTFASGASALVFHPM